jgi:hypothetical protein
MKFRSGEFSTGTTGNFQPELTKVAHYTLSGYFPAPLSTNSRTFKSSS